MGGEVGGVLRERLRLNLVVVEGGGRMGRNEGVCVRGVWKGERLRETGG